MAEIKKLAIFGDSVMQGVLWSEEKKRYSLRQNAFEPLKERGIAIQNYARMGATVEQGLSVMERRLSQVDAQDTLVLLEYGGNDCDYNWKEVSDAPDGEHCPHVLPEAFAESYKKAVEKVRGCGAKVAIASIVPLDAEKYMKWISRNLNYDAILHWLGDVSMLFRWQEYYSRLVENIAKELSCPLVDLRSAFLLTHRYEDCFCPDGIHPTGFGYEMIDRTLANAIGTV